MIIDSSSYSHNYLFLIINSNIPHLKPFDFNTLKELHKKGTSDKQRNRHFDY